MKKAMRFSGTQHCFTSLIVADFHQRYMVNFFNRKILARVNLKCDRTLMPSGSYAHGENHISLWKAVGYSSRATGKAWGIQGNL